MDDRTVRAALERHWDASDGGKVVLVDLECPTPSTFIASPGRTNRLTTLCLPDAVACRNSSAQRGHCASEAPRKKALNCSMDLLARNRECR
jgi:hypothetical protein